MSKGNQNKFIHAKPGSGFRKGRKVVRGLSAAIIASAMMGGGAVAETTFNTDQNLGGDWPIQNWSNGNNKLIIESGITISGNIPNAYWLSAQSFEIDYGTVDRVSLVDGLISLDNGITYVPGGPASLTKLDTNGTAVILGTQGYTGNTLVYGGTLQLGQGGTDASYDGQIASDAGIFAFGSGNLEVRYADGSSFDKDVRLIGDNATFTSWVEGANRVNYIDGLITGHESTSDMSYIDGGRFDKRGAGTTNVRGGVAITGDFDIWNGNLVVEGAVAASDIQTGLHGNSDAQVRVDGGGVEANVHLRLGADLEIEDGGAVVGNVTGGGAGDTADTNVSITDDSRLDGNIALQNGSVTLAGGTELGTGNLIFGNVTIADQGNVTITDYGVITGNVTVEDGHVALTNFGGIDGNVRVYDGYIDLQNNSGIEGDVRIEIGDVVLNTDSGITGNVTLDDGDLDLDNDSNILGAVEVDNGDITLANGSQISGNVHVGNGSVSLSSLSTIVNGFLRIDDATGNPSWQALTINSSGVHGNVSIGTGHVSITNGHIGGDLTIDGVGNLSVTGVGDGIEGDVNLADGSASVTAGGNIDGDVTVVDHDITLNNGLIGGDATARDGNISLNNGSEIGGDATVRDGDITLNNGSDIEGEATVRDGNITLNNGSAIDGDATVRDGDITLNNGSDIDGDATVRNGEISLNNGSDIDGSAIITQDGSVTLTNGSGIGEDVRIGGDGGVSATDSVIGGSIDINTGNVTLNDSMVGQFFGIGDTGNVNIAFGQLLVTDSVVWGNVNVFTGDVIINGLSDNSGVFGDVDVTIGDVNLNSGGIGGNVSIETGSLSAVNDSDIDGNVIVDTGNVLLNDSDVDGNIDITTGNLVANNNSDVDGSVTILGTGDVTLNDSDVDGDVTIATGNFSASNNSDVDGNVAITTGNATLNNSDIDGSLTVTTGNVSLNESTVGSFFGDNGIRIVTGDLSLDNESFVIGDVHITTGDLELLGDSDILGDTYVEYGDVVANEESDFIGDLWIDYGGLALDGDSNVWGDVTIGEGFVSLNLESDILGDLEVYAGDVGLDNGSSVVGTAHLSDGDLFLNHGSSVGGLASLDNGDIDLDNGSVLGNGANVQNGNITLAHGSAINRALVDGEDVTVENGTVNVTTASFINNDVNVLAGQVTVIQDSEINGNVGVEESRPGDLYAVGVETAEINGDVQVGRGNVILNDVGRINGSVLVLDGNLDLNFGSRITAVDPDDSVGVFLGDITLNNYSAINSDVEVNRGNIDLSLGSEIVGDVDVNIGNITADDASGIEGDVTIDEGNLTLTDNSGVMGNVDIYQGVVALSHEAGIYGDVNVTGTDLHRGAVLVNDDSLIEGSVTVGNGDIVVNNFSRIEGALVSTDLGDIDVLNDSNITGHVVINDGHLLVDESSSITGLVDVNADAAANIAGIVEGDVNLNGGGLLTSGGVLYGNPTITGNLFNDGLLTPGFYSDSVGTALVGGDYIQTADGTYRAHITADGRHDRVLVGGEAVLGGTLVVATDANYKAYRNDRFRLLRAEGGRDGRFDNVLHTFPNDTMLEFNIRYSPKSVWAVVNQRKFAELKGLTHNQRQVAGALDHAAVRNQLDRVFDHLNYTHVSNVPGLLQLLSPEQLTSIFTISTASAQLQNVNIERRLDAVRAGRAGSFSSEGLALRNDRGTINIDGAPIANTADGLTLAGWDGKSIVTKEVVEPVVYQSRWSVFVTGHGEWSTIKNTSEALGQDFRTAGVTVGADLRVSENFVIGLTGGYTNTESELSNDGDIKVNSGRGSVYASVFGENAYLNVAAGGGYNSYKTKRATLGGFAQGDSDGGEFNALLGVGYDFHVGGFSIGPVASAQYTYTGLDSFTETGSDAPLHFESQSNDSLRSLVGLKIDYTVNTGSVVIRPEVRAQWKHEYLDTAPSITSRFSGADKYFTVNGPDIGRDSLVLDAGASVEFNNTWAIFAYYTGELGRKNYDSHSVNGGFRVSF